MFKQIKGRSGALMVGLLGLLPSLAMAENAPPP